MPRHISLYLSLVASFIIDYCCCVLEAQTAQKEFVLTHACRDAYFSKEGAFLQYLDLECDGTYSAVCRMMTCLCLSDQKELVKYWLVKKVWKTTDAPRYTTRKKVASAVRLLLGTLFSDFILHAYAHLQLPSSWVHVACLMRVRSQINANATADLCLADIVHAPIQFKGHQRFLLNMLYVPYRATKRRRAYYQTLAKVPRTS